MERKVSRFLSSSIPDVKPIKNSIGALQEVDNDQFYFKCYEGLLIHQAMLKDHQRVEFYQRALQENSGLFKNKVVLDVGSGLGILSFLAAQHGAKKVYAIEAAEKISELCKKAVKLNGFEEKIVVIKGRASICLGHFQKRKY